ncbi:hypothetical protein CYY_004349 [Polysphondylium violaceum]|uniref:Uncharacterized protein n=1 Tax=Polysphondylium violaceum TaxID=133409 RepID=A0A8J4PTG2_9MYCE|nr:hypothetical protein CYY_004349 [Polysphondylium violaceum]
MAFLLNYNFQLRNSNGGISAHPFFVNQRSPPKKYTLSHFDDSFPLDNQTIRPTIRDEDDFKYGGGFQKLDTVEDQLMFVIDDI